MLFKTKYINKILYIFNRCIVAIIGYILFLSIFKPYETYITYKEAHALKPIILIIGLIISSGIFLRYKKYIESSNTKKLCIIISIISIIMVFIQICYILNFKYINYSDLSVVHGAAIELIEKGYLAENNYLNRYTNNIPLTLFWALVFKIFSLIKITNFKVIAMFINLVMVDIFIFIMCLFVKKKYGIKNTTFLLGIIAINPMFYVYLPTYYTNTISLVFYIGLVYAYYLFLKNDKKRYVIIFSILMFIGIKIRVTVGIVAIAVLIHLFFNCSKRKSLSYILILISCFFIGSNLYTHIENKYIKFDYTETRYPITHWLMMGSQGEGGYNGSDVAFTANINTYNEKVKKTTLRFGKRVLDAGIKENIKRINRKIERVWASGTYGFRQNTNNVEEFNFLYPYIIGERSKIFNYYCQIIHITILIFALIYSISNTKKTGWSFNTIYRLVIFGGFIFYIFWEANSRYALMFLPFFMLLSMKGVEEVNKLENKYIEYDFQIKINKNNINFCFKDIIILIDKFKKYILLTIVILFMWNYSFYVKNNIKLYDFSINQYQTNSKTDSIKGNTVIEQTFRTKNSFNTIEIEAVKEKNTNKAYNISIFNKSTGRKLYTKIINLDPTKEVDNIKLSFDTVNLNKNNDFSIKIMEEKSMKNSNDVKFGKYYKSNFDVNPTGELTVNGVFEEGDLKLKVYKVQEGTFMSFTQYIILAIVIIGISLLGLRLKK